MTLALVLTACAACTDNPRDGGTPPEEEIRQNTGVIATDPAASRGPAPEVPGATSGGTVTIFRETALARLDPQRIYSFMGLSVSQLYARRLTTYADDGNGKLTLVGDLAETPGTDVNRDCRTWEFRLKENVRFETGAPVTARDVAYGIARSFDLTLAGGPTYLQEWLADTPQYDKVYDFAADRTALPPGVEVPDDRTLRLTFPKPHCDLPFAAALPATAPVPAAADTGLDYDRKPIATGPYLIEGRTGDTELRLVRNPQWDATTDAVRHAYPDRFTLAFGADPVTQTNRILAAQGADAAAVSYDGIPPSLIPKVTGDSLLRSLTPRHSVLNINTRRVTDLAVRRALNAAINREELVKALGGAAVARPVTTLLPPSTIGWHDYNAYPALPSLGANVPELVLAYPDDAEGQIQGTALANSLRKAGFKILTKPVAADDFLHEIQRADNSWDLYPDYWAPDWPSGAAVLPALYDGRGIKASGGNNGTSYLDSRALDAEFDRILALPLDAQGNEWAALDEKIMREYAPAVPLYVEMTCTVRGPRLGGLFVDGVFGSPAFVNAFVRG
ncbi:peptide/nickel transport system substrate-binding protein [Catenuloplanes nepalensis]|uniref:Peptide/nickel transport system substrate-binding protein n=1 Tax=Catenuloplanes nepalensis TaxID=587533 RepID=A0ABT9MW35_9ACTN|nr:ABC transporter substrate-binding protein [Catenuloplanes nepalensis]MDP9795657.1 peptide/nickel transport system substrate-binding protein [Catenuloplanes nepalensis]